MIVGDLRHLARPDPSRAVPRTAPPHPPPWPTWSPDSGVTNIGQHGGAGSGATRVRAEARRAPGTVDSEAGTTWNHRPRLTLGMFHVEHDGCGSPGQKTGRFTGIPTRRGNRSSRCVGLAGAPGSRTVPADAAYRPVETQWRQARLGPPLTGLGVGGFGHDHQSADLQERRAALRRCGRQPERPGRDSVEQLTEASTRPSSSARPRTTSTWSPRPSRPRVSGGRPSDVRWRPSAPPARPASRRRGPARDAASGPQVDDARRRATQPPPRGRPRIPGHGRSGRRPA